MQQLVSNSASYSPILSDSFSHQIIIEWVSTNTGAFFGGWRKKSDPSHLLVLLWLVTRARLFLLILSFYPNHIRLLNLQANAVGFREDVPAKPRPCRGWSPIFRLIGYVIFLLSRHSVFSCPLPPPLLAFYVMNFWFSSSFVLSYPPPSLARISRAGNIQVFLRILGAQYKIGKSRFNLGLSLAASQSAATTTFLMGKLINGTTNTLYDRSMLSVAILCWREAPTRTWISKENPPILILTSLYPQGRTYWERDRFRLPTYLAHPFFQRVHYIEYMFVCQHVGPTLLVGRNRREELGPF